MFKVTDITIDLAKILAFLIFVYALTKIWGTPTAYFMVVWMIFQMTISMTFTFKK